MPKNALKVVDDGLTPDQRTYVKSRASGKSRQESAAVIGRDYDKAGRAIEDSTAVQVALARERALFADEGRVTRGEIVEGMRDAINMAKLIADPSSMVRGLAELAKITGNYEPEKSSIPNSLRGEIMKRVQAMSDEELLRLSHGRVIDAEQDPAPDTSDIAGAAPS